MSQFFRQEQLAARHFTVQHLHGSSQLEPTARSGWFRLLLSELQEESLRDDENRKKLALAEPESVTAGVAPAQVAPPQKSVTGAPRHKSAPAEMVEDQPDEREVPVRLKPLFRPRLVEVPEVGPVARSVVDELDGWAKEFYRAATEHKAMLSRLRERLERDVAQIRQKRRRKRTAMFLLMAA